MTITGDYFAGNNIDVIRDVTDVEPTDPVTKAWLTVKRYKGDPDASALLQKIITTSSVPGVGQIAQDGGASNGDGTASLLFQITKAESLAIGTPRLWYDIQVMTVLQGVYTAHPPARFQLSGRVTTALS